MTISWTEKNFSLERVERVTASLKNTLKSFHPSLSEPALAFGGGPDNFLLKGPEGYLWGKVYVETLSHAAVDDLQKELDKMFRHKPFPEKLLPHVFFPARAKGVGEGLKRLPGPPKFFEYGQAFVLREADILGPVNVTPGLGPKTYDFNRSSRLNREELAELIDIALELKTA